MTWPVGGPVARIVDHVSDGIAVIDHAWRLLYVNDQGAQLLGRHATALVGQELWQAVPDMAGTVFADAFQRAMRTQEPETFEAPYAPVGRWLEVRITPAPQGLTIYARDATQRHVADQQRNELLARVTAALRRSEQLLEVTDSLARAVTLEAVAATVTGHARDELGCHFAGVALLDRGQSVLRYVGTHTIADRWQEVPCGQRLPSTDAVRRGEPVLFADRATMTAAYPLIEPDLAADGTEALATMPLIASDQAVGALVVAWSAPRVCDDDEQRFLRTLAGQTAQAVERVRLFVRQQGVSTALQHAILPRELPATPGVDLAARYVPADVGVEIGGDWYDAFALPDGRLALTIGDVAGHGLDAAAHMGQLRNAARAYAYDDAEPGDLVTRLNRLLLRTAEDWLATTLFAVLDPPSGTLRWSNAGHPPPAVVDPRAAPHFLEDVHGPPLGADPDARFDETHATLGDAMLLLYTDGLIEQRSRSLSEGLAALLASAESACDTDLDRFCHEVARGALDPREREDDMCMLAARRRRD